MLDTQGQEVARTTIFSSLSKKKAECTRLPSIGTSQLENDNSPYQQVLGKLKREHEGEKDSGNRRSKRLANKRKS